ncbi:unnamed protein product [Schistocephalus solidus]|uniref:ATP-dependent endonuclease n=1 Tax=Schistocephalus solidus TaxID=70667 RepID=A0A183SG29_SCHSO|nr:unnamed protein product [Schistocephalus solidus]
MCLMGDEGFILPGLRAFFEQGWSNVILFTSPTSEPESDMQDAVTRAIRLINPRAIIMSAPNGRIKDMGRFDSLLTEDAFDDPKLQRHRLLTFPQEVYPKLASGCGQKSVEMLTEWLKDWLRSAAPQQSLPKEPLSAEKLTPAMLEEIHELYHLCPLPPGWYYTGSQYVHMNGEKSFKHPCFEQFLKEHVEEENARIAKFNKYLVNHPIPDMFS